MKNWNLRTLVLLRSLTAVALPIWYLTFARGARMGSYPLQMVFFLLYFPMLWLMRALDNAAKPQMDEMAQTLLDKLTHHVEVMTFVLVVVVVAYLLRIVPAERAGEVPTRAAEALIWGFFAAQMYRGVAFWLWDWKGSGC